jgi:hypothetical protein
MPQTVSGFTVPAGSDAVSTIDNTMATMAGQLATRFSTFTTNAQTGTSYTLALSDAGSLVTLSNASAVAVNIPLEATVAWAANTIITLANLGAGIVTVTCTSGTLAGSGFTLAQNEVASLITVGTNSWIMTKGGGLPKASVSSTSGSPTTGANGTKTFYRWTGVGTVTVTTGFVEALIQAGGAGGGSTWGANTEAGGGGGGGGTFYNTMLYLTAGTYSIGVGGGGPGGAGSGGGTKGSTSFLGTYVITGGGAGASSSISNVAGGLGASGGGGFSGGAGGAAEANTLSGYAGGGSNNNSGGGGGGAISAGVTGASGIGGNGGNGLTTTITGSSVITGGGGGGGGVNTRGLGGNSSANGGNGGQNGGTGSVGAVNTGTGGGGSWAQNSTTPGFAGGSGVVVLLIG